MEFKLGKGMGCLETDKPDEKIVILDSEGNQVAQIILQSLKAEDYYRLAQNYDPEIVAKAVKSWDIKENGEVLPITPENCARFSTIKTNSTFSELNLGLKEFIWSHIRKMNLLTEEERKNSERESESNLSRSRDGFPNVNPTT
ncbi:MAG: hypothetical protein ACOZAL_00615 [Patescibacteria group bacterium]